MAGGLDRSTMGTSLFIDPVIVDYHIPHLPGLSGLHDADALIGPGMPARKSRGGGINVIVLSNIARFGPEQRRWSAKPVISTHDRSARDDALEPGPFPALGGAEPRTLELFDQLEAWVNEGRAGGNMPS